MGASGEGKGRVCVTGGTGYLGSWLIMRLLEAGYYLHTTIRDSNKDVSFLTKLPGASERLKIFIANLDKPESFEAAIEGCDGVFHVAHPMEIFSGKEPEEVVSRRAVNAALGILEACLKHKTVKRVIYTSSTAAVGVKGGDLGELDEESWSDVDFIRTYLMNSGGTYFVSKTLTEKAVQEFAEKTGLNVVTINPSWIQGPFLTPSSPESVRLMMPMVFGEPSPFSDFPIVHIDDVASAEIHLFEYPNAKGRYICSAFDITIDKLAEFLSTKYPELGIPQIDYSEQLRSKTAKKWSFASKKLLDTGFRFKYDLDETYRGAIQSCKDKGIL